MDYIQKERFDLTALLKKSDLNIRSLAAITPNLTAGEYFDMLSELLRQAPVLISDLHKLISRDGDRNTYKNLAGTFTLLKNLGYERHAIDFDGVLDAYDRGHSRTTSAYAKKIMDDFDELCTQIKAARITQQPGAIDDNPDGLSLKEWIDRLYRQYHQPGEDIVRKPVILAVDDSPMILRSVSSLLGNDYKVYTLAKSAMLEKVLSQITPDLFLLDYNMPVLTGFELIPIIRGFEEHKDTPIIFLTSERTIDNVSGAVRLGACDFIVKPVQPNILRERVSKHIA